MHELTFLLAIAIAFAWKVRAVRRALLLLFAAHLAVRAWTLAYFAPSIIRFQAIPPSGPVTGQSLGAHKPERGEQAVWTAGRYNMVFLGTVLYIIGAVLTDISYALVDPRVRLG